MTNMNGLRPRLSVISKLAPQWKGPVRSQENLRFDTALAVW